MALKDLIGAGSKIARVTLPFFIVGLVLNILYPAWFDVKGPSNLLFRVSVIVLLIGISNYVWSVALILKKVPRGELITTGPFSMVKHPIYTGMALLVLPWAGFLLNSWLGVLIGAIIYIATRVYSQEEERKLAEVFGQAWEEYSKKVLLPWL